MDGLLALRITPNLEDQAICFRGFLPLGFTDPSVNRKAAVLVLVCPGYFISLVPNISGERSPIRHPGRHPMGDQSLHTGSWHFLCSYCALLHSTGFPCCTHRLLVYMCFISFIVSCSLVGSPVVDISTASNK